VNALLLLTAIYVRLKSVVCSLCQGPNHLCIDEVQELYHLFQDQNRLHMEAIKEQGDADISSLESLIDLQFLLWKWSLAKDTGHDWQNSDD
jgi:hypothetical protein